MNSFAFALGPGDPPALIMLPFAALLLCIALAPLILKHHWERLYHIVSLGLAAVTASYYIFVLRSGERMLHVGFEYFSFIAVIGSLYVVTGGIHLVVKGEAKPSVNALFLGLGAVLANFIGTTGASMLLIRPWIRMNNYRFTSLHTAFFIFIVSNVGGCLTPIGDPPLFLGFLKGVPFCWVLEHCWPAWTLAVGLLITIFYFVDRHNFQRAPRKVRERQTEHETWKAEGLFNIFFLAIILGAVFIPRPAGLREALMIAAAFASYCTTGRPIHEANDFNFAPIKEVAWLFMGIFATMVPVLDFLQMHGGQLGLRSPMQFYWLSGALSSVLDNAPTYLTFLAAAFGLAGLDLDRPAHMTQFLQGHQQFLVAISLGAVFFGAVTYIGNGPNLMVKAVTDHAKLRPPSFFGYVFKFALPVLLPIFALISFLFFRR